MIDAVLPVANAVEPVGALREQPREQPREQRLAVTAKFFHGLSDLTRLRIVELLLEGEKNVSELVVLLGQPQSRVSNHLACLRWCGYVDSRRQGRFVYYRIADPRVRQLLALARGVIADNAAAVLGCTRI